MVYNLRLESQQSRSLARDTGLIYHELLVEDWNVPRPEQVQEFLEMLAEPEGVMAPGLVHCWGGVGRTGIFVSCYRVARGMDLEEAIDLSDRETPHLLMSPLQRDWLRAHQHRWKWPPI